VDEHHGSALKSATIRRVLWVRALRAFADGYVSLLLPVYLIALGFSAFEVGVIATATLLGSAALSLLVGLRAHRVEYRSLLLAASGLMAATGFAFAGFTDFWPLLVVAIAGTLNPSSGDVSVFLPLEQSLVAHSVEDSQRTSMFARYSLVGALVGAVGALFAGAPELAVKALGVEPKRALQLMFALYGVIGIASALLYRGLPSTRTGDAPAAAPLGKSRRIVFTLAALFSLDAFGGGFIVQSLLALWLFERFQLSTAVAGTIFFWSGVFSAVSYLVAVRIAKRIGLVNTMVFTHLPANFMLIAMPFVPDLAWVIVLLLARAALSQMDVPTRGSYVMAVVTPAERPAAASVTSVPRSLASAVSPLLAGAMLGVSAFGWPLIVAGVTKSVYDVALLLMFRTVRPPEEAQSASSR
jgi:MFS family permease